MAYLGELEIIELHNKIINWDGIRIHKIDDKIQVEIGGKQ